VREAWRVDGIDIQSGADVESMTDNLQYREEMLNDRGFTDCKWKPSIHMPRWASRITLEVTGVRVERVQAITEADAEAEGIAFMRDIPDADETLTAKVLFEILWESINAKRGYGWDVNPWVWVVEFRRVAL